jgi:quercetin dioxygenase-like cupin family protein
MDELQYFEAEAVLMFFVRFLRRSLQMQIIRWQSNTQPQEQELRARMQQDGLSPYAWSNEPGAHYATHSHSYEKVLYCVRGSIRYIMHDQSNESGSERFLDLTPGDCMILPAGVRHSADVGPQGVTCLEAAHYHDKDSRVRSA